MNNQYIAPNRLKERRSVKSKDHAAPAKARKAARIADPVPKTCCHRNGDTRIRKGNNVAKRFIINFGIRPLHTSTSVPTFGEIGVMPTKGKGEPSCKSIEGSPTLAGVHSAKVSTKILLLRAGSRLVTPGSS